MCAFCNLASVSWSSGALWKLMSHEIQEGSMLFNFTPISSIASQVKASKLAKRKSSIRWFMLSIFVSQGLYILNFNERGGSRMLMELKLSIAFCNAEFCWPTYPSKFGSSFLNSASSELTTLTASSSSNSKANWGLQRHYFPKIIVRSIIIESCDVKTNFHYLFVLFA